MTPARTWDCGPAVFMSWRFCCRIWGLDKGFALYRWFNNWEYLENQKAVKRKKLPCSVSQSPLEGWWKEAQTGFGSPSWWPCCRLELPLLPSATKGKTVNIKTMSKNASYHTRSVHILYGHFTTLCSTKQPRLNSAFKNAVDEITCIFVTVILCLYILFLVLFVLVFLVRK